MQKRNLRKTGILTKILQMKAHDYLLSLLLFFRIFNLTFIIKLSKLKSKVFSPSNFFKVFAPLLTQQTLKYPKTLKEVEGIFNERRSEIFKNFKNDFFASSSLILFLFFGLINPYTFLHTIIIFCSIVKFYSNFAFDENLKPIMISLTFDSIKINLLVIFVHFPIHVILLLISPWNVLSVYSFSKKHLKFLYIRISDLFSKSYSDMIYDSKDTNLVQNSENNSENSVLLKNSKIFILNRIQNFNRSVLFQTYEMFENFIEGWKIILKFILIHISVLRIFSLYNDFFVILKVKKGKCIIAKSSSYNCLFFSSGTSNKLQTISSQNLFTIYTYFLHKHSIMVVKEIYVYPLMVVYIILTPWNYMEILHFMTINNLEEKYVYFLNLSFKIVLYDLFVMMGTICLLLSVLQTYDTSKLIYYGIKKRFFLSSEATLEYDIYFKYNFKKEIQMAFTKLLKKVLSAILIILNTLLILRIYSLLRRLYPFLKDHIISEYIILKGIIYKKPPKDKNIKELNLKNFSKSAITCISQFLNPEDITKLGMSCITLHNKMNTNLVWEHQYNNYYMVLISNQNKNNDEYVYFSKGKKKVVELFAFFFLIYSQLFISCCCCCY